MQLESKNKEIMREIQKLRRQQEAEQVQPESPALMNELRALRQRKGELEGHLGALQDSRRQLMAQLEGLMRMLKNHQTQSPRSTPNSSPRSGKSPPLPQGTKVYVFHSLFQYLIPLIVSQVHKCPVNHGDPGCLQMCHPICSKVFCYNSSNSSSNNNFNNSSK